jgi:O-antigen/teichoic acid export membrane protein
LSGPGIPGRHVIAPPATGEAEAERSPLRPRIMRWRRFLRVRPFDTATLEGRSAERYRRIAWSTLLAAVARMVGIATSFISVPLVIGYLGSERYGMWITMSSLVAALGPLDLGIGLGLLTVISDAHGRDDRATARRAIATAAAMLTLIGAVAAVIFAFTYPAIPWARIFNVVSPTAAAEAGPASAVLFAAFALGLPLGIIGQVQLAYQSGYISSAWAIAGNVGSLVALIAVISLRGSLPVLVVALTGVGLVAAALNGWFLFRRQRRWLMPRRHDIDLSTARSLLKTGTLFLVLQLAGLAGYQLDYLVIAQLLGPSKVQEYAVPAKLFILAPTLLSFALTPLWPAYRESLARGDAAWVRRTLRRSIILAAAINIPSTLVLVVLAPWLLQVWVGSAVHPTLLLLVGLGAWTILNTLNGPFSMLLNGANVIAFQAVFAVAMAVANVTISILLVQRIGVSGAVYGSVIAQTFFGLAPQLWYVRRLMGRLARTSAGVAPP